MIEVVGDLWTYPADVRVVTTNGTIKTNGECVMGRGCAKEAKNRWPDIAKVLGEEVRARGNHVNLLRADPIIFSFPVKHEWYEQADPDLITKSAMELSLAIGLQQKVVVMPRPGCGNGRLRWEDVKPILEPILDNRFHVITWR